MPNIQLEGFAIPLIAFKYPSDKYQRLEEVLQKLGILPLKKGDPVSKKYQLLMDMLIDGKLMTNPVTVTTQKPPSNDRYCQHIGWVKINKECERCRLAYPQRWLNCHHVIASTKATPAGSEIR